MRLFLAFCPDDAVRGRLEELQSEWKDLAESHKWTAVSNLHMTLVFLGEYPPESADEVCKAIQTIPVPSFDLHVSHPGMFGKILYAGTEEDERLNEYVLLLKQALTEAGFTYDPKPFVPHITMARKAEVENLPGLCFEAFSFVTDGISLMESVSTETGVKYNELRRLH